MKLAEALRLRSDLQSKMEQLDQRLYNNATVQEGERPVENPVELLAEFEECAVQLEDLIGRINLTNSRVMTDGRTLTELLARRDCLKMQAKTYQNFQPVRLGRMSCRLRGTNETYLNKYTNICEYLVDFYAYFANYVSC